MNYTATLGALLLASLGTLTALQSPESKARSAEESDPMQLGNFSVSLAVKDIRASKAFYEKLGFREFGGSIEQNWLILQNETATIGLFQGMFENNIMTFNPGWDRSAKKLKEFQDVRELQAELKEAGIGFATEADPESSGPASFVIIDPDGNTILVDQHVPGPKR